MYQTGGNWSSWEITGFAGPYIEEWGNNKNIIILIVIIIHSRTLLRQWWHLFSSEIFYLSVKHPSTFGVKNCVCAIISGPWKTSTSCFQCPEKSLNAWLATILIIPHQIQGRIHEFLIGGPNFNSVNTTETFCRDLILLTTPSLFPNKAPPPTTFHCGICLEFRLVAKYNDFPSKNKSTSCMIIDDPVNWWIQHHSSSNKKGYLEKGFPDHPPTPLQDLLLKLQPFYQRERSAHLWWCMSTHIP